MWTLALWSILDGNQVCAANSTHNCKLLVESDQKVLSQLEPLANKK